ncbi:hypothetical protein [Streptomyces sp. NPDC047315]|uniref:hypothetical protein n=1 Tax=Streptomyces sp. NPDC047315 TaxID=3155142 RepID=UPI0033EC13B3
MTTTANAIRTGRDLVPPDLVDSIVHFVVAHFGQQPERAERQADRALAFVATLEAVTTSAPAIKAAGFTVHDDRWTVDDENAAQCDSDCGRPYGRSE